MQYFYYANTHMHYNMEPELTTLTNTHTHTHRLTCQHTNAHSPIHSTYKLAYGTLISGWSQVDWPFQKFTCQKWILTILICDTCIAFIQMMYLHLLWFHLTVVVFLQHHFLQDHAAIFIPASSGKTDWLGHLAPQICIESHSSINLSPSFTWRLTYAIIRLSGRNQMDHMWTLCF